MAATTRATTTRAARGHRRARNLIVALTASAALVAAGCGSDSSEEATSTPLRKAAGCQSGSESGTRVIRRHLPRRCGGTGDPATHRRGLARRQSAPRPRGSAGRPARRLQAERDPGRTGQGQGPAHGRVDLRRSERGKTLSLKPDLVVTSIRDIVETLAVEKLKDKVPVAAFGILEPADVWRNYTRSPTPWAAATRSLPI